MKRTLTVLIAATGVFLLRAQDQCSTALAITAGTYTVDTVDGIEPPQPNCTGGVIATHGEWYSWTAANDTLVTITTDLPVNVGRDTRFHVYTGVCGALTCVAGDDDGGSGFLSIASFDAVGGTTYRIAFDDYWESNGFDFQLAESPVPFVAVGFTPLLTLSSYSNCVVDMNGDNLDDVVIPGTSTVQVYEQQVGGGLTLNTLPTPAADHTASWSIAAGDLDRNGYTDLLYGGGSGATFMYANDSYTGFDEHSYPQYIFCQRTNMVDIDNDGDLDGFSCHDTQANVYFLNNGTDSLLYNQGGFGSTCGNYGSIWVDYDNDHDMDLFVAKCGCDPVDLFLRNDGGLTYTPVAAALGFADSHQSWSSAWGDFDNDGDMDVLVGSSSSSYHKLMRNDGGTFVNVTTGSGLDLFSGQSIEWTTHDFDNDGHLDILGGNGFLLGNGDMTFTESVITPTNGPIGDVNNDGFLDIVSGSTVYANDGNSNHWLTVNTIGTISNADGIGARVEVQSASFTQMRDVRSGDGFRNMSSLNSHFGLGADDTIDQVTIFWPSGIVDVIPNPTIDQPLEVVEGTFNAINEPIAFPGLSLSPDPAVDQLHIQAEGSVEDERVNVIDVTGHLVISTPVKDGAIAVNGLKAGTYMVLLNHHGRLLRERFVKAD